MNHPIRASVVGVGAGVLVAVVALASGRTTGSLVPRIAPYGHSVNDLAPGEYWLLGDAGHVLDSVATAMIQDMIPRDSFLTGTNYGLLGQSSNILDGIGVFAQINGSSYEIPYTVTCMVDRVFRNCNRSTPGFAGTIPPARIAIFRIDVDVVEGQELVVMFHVKDEYKFTLNTSSSAAVHGGGARMPVDWELETTAPENSVACNQPFLHRERGPLEVYVGACDTASNVTLLAFNETGLPSIVGTYHSTAMRSVALDVDPLQIPGEFIQFASITSNPEIEMGTGVQWSVWRFTGDVE
jgi:hypothetical protein